MDRRIQIAVDCADPGRLARFWAQALGYEVETAPEGFASWHEFSLEYGAPGEGWSAVVDPAGVGPRVLFHSVPEVKTGKNRWHLDVRIGRANVDAEVVRLGALGASHLRTVADESDYYAVLRDPEGNEFCVC
ncbi:VOC family protein [Prauserella cavernicola]|uniref:VOC family protein n=1 Tax=Prauserella cavernicola TaxID=2800127 RepID=A0A934QPA7_9PSEU|nr:VOC family protein [Prauserella cavernicola]MBK1784281.1 VOC family protein [Prauserella cavernicola]